MADNYNLMPTIWMLADSTLATQKYFRPGQIQLVRRKIEQNQVVTLCESGRLVVTDMTANRIETVELVLAEIQKSDETGSTYTFCGFTSLRSFITSTIGMRGWIYYKPVGFSLASSILAQLAHSDFTDQEAEEDLFSCKLTLRRVVSS